MALKGLPVAGTACPLVDGAVAVVVLTIAQLWALSAPVAVLLCIAIQEAQRYADAAIEALDAAFTGPERELLETIAMEVISRRS